MARFFHRRPRGEPEVEPPQLETPPVVSPVVSRVSSVSPFPVATPGAVSETDGDYFQPLSEIPSAQSHLSVRRTEDARPPQRLSERPYLEGRLRAPSIRLRRLSNGSLNSSNRNSLVSNDGGFFEGFDGGRQRSISQPERARVNDGPPIAMHSARVPQIALPRLTEEGGRPSLAELGVSPTSPYGSPLPTSPLSPTLSLPDQRPSPYEQQAQRSRMQRARNISKALWPPYHRHAKQQQSQGQEQQLDPTDPNNKLEYANELVDWLDTIDPEVQTLSTLTNVQNSLFIPDLGHWLNRRPTYVLSENDPQSRWAKGALQEEKRQEQLAREPTIREPTIREPSVLELPTTPGIQRSNTITSRLTDSHYAALPHGTNLEGWTAEEKEELDDHVRHMLHSRRARWKRQLKGFGQYVRRPLGFFVTLYATLITLFGLAWVLFLIGWIYVGDKQYYVIHIIDSVLVALFAIMGDGLAPFRAVDTYHMIYIARYSRIINNKKKGKKPRARLQKKNMPPDVREELERAAWEEEQRRLFPGLSQDQGTGNRGSQEPLTDLENAKTEFDPSWLTPKQQKSLEHHQAKLAKSHSFYKPYETFTHNAFPLSYLIAIVVLLDCHSCLQISLGACTWGIDYHVRPFALTTVILCVSITCNITAGLVITIGDRKTRKKDVMKLLDRQELTGDAIKHMEEKKKKEQEKEDSSNPESPREGILGGVLSKETSLDSGKEKGRTKLTKDPSSSSSS